MTDTSVSASSVAEARLSPAPDRNNVGNEVKTSSLVPEDVVTQADPAPSRQRSRSLSSQSSLSELSDLSDLPDDETDSKAKEPAKEDVTNSSSMDVDGGVSENAPPTRSQRIRKRTYDSDSDYLLPSLKKKVRLPSTLAAKGRSTGKEILQKIATPTDSDLSSLSHEGDGQASIKDMQAAEKEEEQEEEEDDAEPDEDEERDERLASLRGTNGSTAVGKWIDPYPDGTLGKQVSRHASDRADVYLFTAVWAQSTCSLSKKCLFILIDLPHCSQGLPLLSCRDSQRRIRLRQDTGSCMANEAQDHRNAESVVGPVLRSHEELCVGHPGLPV